MSPELLAAVKERLELGHSVESISGELRAAGYEEAAIAAAIEAAQAPEGASPATTIPVVPGYDTTPVSLPNFSNLFTESFLYAWRQRRLVGWYCVVLLGFFLLLGLSLGLAFVQPIAGSIAMFLVLIGGAIGLQVFGLAVQRVVAIDDMTGQVSLAEGWGWARTRFFFAGFWVLFLAGLISQGAMSLLLVPFIVIGPFLSFMVYAFILEDFRGMTSVFRARELGRGNWAALAGRKVAFWFLVSLPMVVLIGGVTAVVLYGIDPNIQFTETEFFALVSGGVGVVILVSVLVAVLYGIFATLAGIRFNVSLFARLAAARPVGPESGTASDKWKYIVLAVIGALSMFSYGDDNGYGQQFEDRWGNESENGDMISPEIFKERARDIRSYAE